MPKKHELITNAPEATRAWMLRYDSANREGTVGFRIRLNELRFTDDRPAERGCEVLISAVPLSGPLEKLSLPMTLETDSVEASCYFRGNHNIVQVEAIRLVAYSGHGTVLVHFDLKIDIADGPPGFYHLVLTNVLTALPGTDSEASPRHVPEIGTLRLHRGLFSGVVEHPQFGDLEITVANRESCLLVAREFMAGKRFSLAEVGDVLSAELADQFQERVRAGDVSVECFCVRSVSMTEMDGKVVVILVLNCNKLPGHWSLTMRPTSKGGVLFWDPDCDS